LTVRNASSRWPARTTTNTMSSPSLDDAGSVMHEHLEDAVAIRQIGRDRVHALASDALVLLEREVRRAVVVRGVLRANPSRERRDRAGALGPGGRADPVDQLLEGDPRFGVRERLDEAIEVDIVRLVRGRDRRPGHVVRIEVVAEQYGRDAQSAVAERDEVVVVGGESV